MARADLRVGGADRSIVRLHAFQGLVFGIALKKRRFQLLQLAGDVVVLMKRRVREDRREDAFGEDVLDQHLAHVGCRKPCAGLEAD